MAAARSSPGCSAPISLGFHTFAYLRHFVASLLHVDGVEADIDRVRIGDREVQLGVFPMGVDAARFSELAQDPEVLAEAEAIRRDAGGRHIVLGVDRLDYTRASRGGCRPIERLLTRKPELRDSIRYIQVAVPSRSRRRFLPAVQAQVEESVGRDQRRVRHARARRRSTTCIDRCRCASSSRCTARPT